MTQRYIPVYDAFKGGWSLPATPQAIVGQRPDGSHPTHAEFVALGKQLLENNIISPVDQARIQNVITRLNIPSEYSEHIYKIIAQLYLYDCYRLLSTDEIGKKKYELSKQDRMRARNRAAILAFYLKRSDFAPVIKEIYDIIHVKRGVTKAEMLEEMTEPGSWSEVNDGVLPRIDDDGYGPKNDKTPWSQDWNILTPELIARAVGLLNKTTKSGITLDPTTLAQAAQGYVPGEEELSASNAKKTKRKANKASVDMEDEDMEDEEMMDSTPKVKKAKAKPASSESGGKKRKPRPKITVTDAEYEPYIEEVPKSKPKKKKRPKIVFTEEDIEEEPAPKSKSTKKKRPKIVFTEEDIEEEAPKSKPKKKKRPKVVFTEEDIEEETPRKKKKKKGGSALWDAFYHRTGGYRKSQFYPGLIWSRQ